MRKGNRIASDERFDVYFSPDLEDVKISDAEFKMSIKEMDELQLREYLSSIKKQNLLLDYKNELRLYSKEIDEDRIELLLSVLMFSSGRIKSGNQLTEYNDEFIDVYFLMYLLKDGKIYNADAIQKYGCDILLVGIIYDENEKKHTCQIEKFEYNRS